MQMIRVQTQQGMSEKDQLQDMILQTILMQRRAHWHQPMPDVPQRLAWLDALERLLLENEESLIQAVSSDYGHRSRHETLMLEINPVVASIRQAKRKLRRWMRPQKRDVNRLLYGAISNRVVPEPLGVVGVIAPWNFPIMLSLSPLVSILAAGNRAIIKLSEHSQHLAAWMQANIRNYFEPEEVTLLAETGEVGQILAGMPLDHLVFTGSEKTAQRVMQSAAKHLTPLTLELGGKSPAIIAPDFDLETACRRILFGKILNAGQICVSVDHVYTPRAWVQQFVDIAQAKAQQWLGSLNSPDYSSLIHAQAYQRMQALLEQAQKMGAQVIPLLPTSEDDAHHHRMSPCLVLNAPLECDLMQEEIFGPILPIVAYDDMESVIWNIQRQAKPLALYPFTNDKQLLEQILTRIQSGGVTVNDIMLHVGQEDLPFGGVGASGMGHYHGHDGFLNFSKLRPITYQTRWTALELLRPPYATLMSMVAKWAKKLF